MGKTTFIYQGPGVCSKSLENVYKIGKSLLEGAVVFITPEEIIAGKLRGSCLIMPGGRDLPYVRSLKGEGCAQIRRFVEAGGHYIGICAGAYFGGSYVSFDEGGPLEVLGARELKFYQGTVSGPVYGPFDYYSIKGASAVEIAWEEKLHVYFNGGGAFIGGHGKTLAAYPNNLPAIVEIDVGLGRALLSGVHFEYLPEHLEQDDPIGKQLDGAALRRLQKALLLSAFPH